MNLTYTVQEIVTIALSKVGIDGNNCESATVELAQRNLNLLVGLWSADPDLAVQRMIPIAGFATLSEAVNLPLEYCQAMALNLAVNLQSDFDQPRDARLEALATDALEKIKIYNIRRISGSIPTNKR